MKARRPLPTVVLVVAALVSGVLLGQPASAAARGLTHHAVKKIAAKVVRAKAPGLSVAHAATAGDAGTLAGAPPGAYQETRQVITKTVAIGDASKLEGVGIPLGEGDYEVSWSAELVGGSGTSKCELGWWYVGAAGQTDVTASDSSDMADPSLGGVGVIHVVGPQPIHLERFWFLNCSSDTAFHTPPGVPIQVVVTPLDHVTRQVYTY